MLIFLITDENFDQLKSRKEKNKMGIITKLHKSKNSVQISVNTMAPFAIYKWEQAGHFAISNKLDEITKYIAPLGYELTFTPTDSKYVRAYPNSVDKARSCSNVEKITCWNTVVAERNGTLQITQQPKQPFSVSLTTNRGVNLLLKWLKKYLIIATKEINNSNFIPTLTGGLDTRTLTWFWRDLYQGPDYYLNAVRSNSQNSIAKGQAEIEIASQVLKGLGKSLERKEERNHQSTFSGIFTDNGYGWRNCLNDATFIYDFIVFHFGYEGEKYFSSSVCPFVDDLYLQLSHPEKHYMRTLLALLLCPDLLDIPLYSYSDKPQYLLNEEFAYLIPKVEKFIQEHDLRNRVAKIKTKVMSFRWLYQIESRVFSLFRKLSHH